MIVRNIRNKIKLLFSAEKELYSSLKKLTGCCPNHIELYQIALTHKSQSVRQKGRSLNNERLEFLGDAVLETVVSDIVFRHFPKKSEGFLTNLRSRIVRRESLNKVAESIGLNQYISASNNSTSHNSYLGGNALEALIGAIYLDLGFRACQRFVVHKVLPVLGSLEQISEEEVNFKSKLVEWCQKNHVKLEYTLKQREGTDDNAPLFVSKVLLENSMAGSGTGYSKKEAHQNASKEVLALLHRKPKYVQTILKKRDERAPEEPAAKKQAETVVEAAPRRKRKGRGAAADKPSGSEKAATAEKKSERTADKPSSERAVKPAAGNQLPAEVPVQPTAVVKTPKKEKKVPQTVKPAGVPATKEKPAVPAVVEPKPEPAARKPRPPKAESRPASEAEQAENKRKEDIIRQAEEAAFAEHTD